MLKIGVIGYGNRISNVIRDIIAVGNGEVKISAIADIDIPAAKERAVQNGIEDCVFYENAEEMIKKEKLDGICIGTRCSLHTRFALLAAKFGIPMFLEKPVCTTYEDLENLKEILHHSDKTVVSFPLRMTDMVLHIKEIIESGRLGRVEHIQAYNNVPYGRGYYHKWYRDEKETGGLFLQKATHDLDYINYVLSGISPIRVCAMKSKQVFGGDKPEGLMCKDCNERKTCPESPENVKKLGDGYIIGEYCCFAKDTGNEDSGSAIIEFDNGMHAVYSQNFIVRGEAGKRGARFICYGGTIEFDFNSGILTLYHHDKMITETHKFSKNAGHFGGDTRLAENFIGVMKGIEKSKTPLADGILSAELCLAARKSSEEHIFINI